MMSIMSMCQILLTIIQAKKMKKNTQNGSRDFPRKNSLIRFIVILHIMIHQLVIQNCRLMEKNF